LNNPAYAAPRMSQLLTADTSDVRNDPPSTFSKPSV